MAFRESRIRGERAASGSIKRYRKSRPRIRLRRRSSWASSAPLGEGSRVELCFPLAKQGLVQLPAQPSYQNDLGTGLVFDGLPKATREALADYVTARLAT